MKNHNSRYYGKWSMFCAVAALVAASGQACPPEMPPPVNSLTGVWTGPVSGEGTVSTRENNPSPSNPQDSVLDATFNITGTAHVVVNDSIRLISLPVVLMPYDGFFLERAINVFNVGETQTFSSESTRINPSGTTDTNTLEFSFQTTLRVLESEVTTDHFRVVYEATGVNTTNSTSTAMGFTPSSETKTSTGTLTLEGTLTDGHLVISAEFNLNGSSLLTSGTTIISGNAFCAGGVAGTLTRN